MKNLRDTVERYLETEPKARERKNKDRAMVNLLMQSHPALKEAITEKLLSKDDVATMFQEYASMDRSWRKILEERPEMRGSDYGEKDELESRKLEELGYREVVTL